MNQKKKQNKNNKVLQRKKVTQGQKMADFASRAIGSWGYIGFQTVLILVWVSLNVYGYVKSWDPYPFILLNLSLSVLSAYAAPIILMSQNRSAEHDRIQMINDLATDRKAERGIQKIQKTLARIERNLGKVKKEQ